jgi:hypothetical protein
MAEIAIQTAALARYFGVTPRIALLSYSTYGSAAGAGPAKMRDAAALIRQRRPELEVDGELQASTALSADVRRTEFPFSTLQDDANVFVFPGLDAANLSGVPDAKQHTWRVLDRDRRRVWWVTAMTLVTWLLGVALVVWVFVAAGFLMPKLAQLMLISHWYENREPEGKADKLAYGLSGIILQLQLAEVPDATG